MCWEGAADLPMPMEEGESKAAEGRALAAGG